MCTLVLGVPHKAMAAKSNAKSYLRCSTALSSLESADPRAVAAHLLANQLNFRNIRRHLEALTGERPIFIAYHLTDRASDANREWTRAYIFNLLSKLGYSPSVERFDDGLNFYFDVKGTEFPDEYLEVTAHYDTASTGVPGADDNGSGLSVLLELSRILRLHPPRRSVRITFMDREEKGFKGSEFHVRQLQKEFGSSNSPDVPSKTLIGTLVIDGIGYNPRGEETVVVLEVGRQCDYGQRSYYWRDSEEESSPSSQSSSQAHQMTLTCASGACYQFLRFADEKQRRNGLKLTVETETARPSTADHGSYWKVSLPAMLLAAPYDDEYENPGYHTSRDTISGMNWDYYSAVAKFSVEIVAYLAEVDPRFEDTPRNWAILQTVAAGENAAVSQAANHIAALESKPKARSFWGSSFESSGFKSARVKIKNSSVVPVALVLSSTDFSNAHLLDANGKDVYVWSQTEIRELLRLASNNGIPVLRKVAGTFSMSDSDQVVRWLRLPKMSRERSALPRELHLVSNAELDRATEHRDSGASMD